MTSINKSILFHNNTDLPLMIDSWVEHSSTLQSLRIGPREKMIIYSSVGEWLLNSMFPEEEDRAIWKEKSFSKYLNLGKFHCEPSASGNYSWMENDDLFDCVYSNIDEPMITFSTTI